jgi:hypothetical protein
VLKDPDFSKNTSKRASDSLSFVAPSKGVASIEHCRAVIKRHRSRANHLLSDGIVRDSDTIASTIKTGAALTSDNVLECLWAKEEKRRQK